MALPAIDFGFFFQPAGFDISHAPLAFAATDSFARAFAVGLINTLLMATLAGVGALVAGVFVGVGTVIGNAFGRAVLNGFIGLMRNLPKLLILLAIYILFIQNMPLPREPFNPLPGVFLSNRGLSFPAIDWATLSLDIPVMGRFGVSGGMIIPTQFVVLWLALALYHGAQIGEIVRGGLRSIGKGQWEAAAALGLGTRLKLKLVILPQVYRQVIPSLISQFINLLKNTSIGLAVGFADLMAVASTTINQAFKPIEVMTVVMLVYLSIGLLLSLALNTLNDRLRRGMA
ncbi:MAG: ABC transporter permease subunit [Burkholderiaceae bacterium]|nr:ABC transporter permease subunit [Burkholderiaceae bacterium]MCD8517785.1 ABC transporter permease subunit [Burkholderiaceae bacterium]MCD8538005.1 ABC transporter permease subunit [Burkholderiaceae bacterium]MCD8564204.1 ABC transporter permease subunit [Burkholderiaceae bacterium]